MKRQSTTRLSARAAARAKGLELIAVPALVAAGLFSTSGALSSQDETILSQLEIGDGTGGFGGTLDDFDFFGGAIEPIGDLDGDGVVDLMVGAVGDNDGPGTFPGAVWVLFLEAGGSVRAQ